MGERDQPSNGQSVFPAGFVAEQPMADADFHRAYLRDIVRTFRYQKKLGDGALAQVSERDLLTALNPVDNSIAVIVRHLAGNFRSRYTDFLTSDGEKPDRNRDAEFVTAEPPSRDQVQRWWEAGWTIVLAAIESLTPEDLDRTITIRHEPFLVLEALNRSATHTAYHVGQIVYLARHFAGENWKTLTIPKGQSAAATGKYKAATGS
jgi:Protein of unknown function (DUF1572)